MAGLVIPVFPELESWKQRTSLDGTDYVLSFTWNARAERWSLILYDASENLLRAGTLVDSFTNLLFSPSEDMPQGVLAAIDLQGMNRAPDLDTFGASVILKYYPPGDAP